MALSSYRRRKRSPFEWNEWRRLITTLPVPTVSISPGRDDLCQRSPMCLSDENCEWAPNQSYSIKNRGTGLVNLPYSRQIPDGAEAY